MYWQTKEDLVALFGVIAAGLLVLAIIAGVIAALKTFQVRQFQDLLFKAERKIDNLERRMFNVLNAVPVALVETDTTGKFTFANKAAHLLLGRKDSELIGLRFHAATWGITYPDGRQVPPDLMPISRTLRGQTVKGFQHMLTNHGSHEKVLVSVTSMPIMNGMGEVIGSTAALVEIENGTGEGIDDLTGLWRGHWFAAATVPFWGLDASGQVLDINNAALDAFELKRDEVLGQNWAQLFVENSDFQEALDYLGDIQDAGDPHAQTSVRLRLKSGDGDAVPALVTAWVVRTHEGGDNGLTLMAMAGADAENLAVAGPAPQPQLAALSDEDALELADFRAAERALANLGVGTWQYDAEADTIVEDAGMQALIGREVPGGPTLISDADQERADAAFRSLMSGASNSMAMDLKVVQKDGSERWITIKGEAFPAADGREREIFGLAFDCTEWKSAQPVTDAAPVPVAVAAEVDLDAIRQEARDAAVADHQAELDQLRQAHATAMAEAEARHAMALSVLTAAGVVPDSGSEPVASDGEAERLQAELDATREQLRAATEAAAALEARVAASGERYDDLAQRYHVLSEAEDVPVPDSGVHEAQLAELENRLATAEAARSEAQSRLDEALAAPPPEPDFSSYELRIDDLQRRLEQATDRYDDLAQRYHTLANAPDPEPDFGEHEARIDAATAAAETAQAERDGWKARYEALASAPPPDTSGLESDLAAARFELAKWQAAHRDLQVRLDQVAAQPVVDHHALEVRIDELQGALAQAREQQAQVEARLQQVSAAHSHAQRFETVGRLTGDVAQDFSQMLSVINNALDAIARNGEAPEGTRRLAEAALAAGKRGERLTRQLQAFQSEEF